MFNQIKQKQKRILTYIIFFKTATIINCLIAIVFIDAVMEIVVKNDDKQTLMLHLANGLLAAY